MPTSHLHSPPSKNLYELIIHTHPFNGPLSGTTRVSRYQNGKTNWTILKQETVSGRGISWAICKSAPRSRQITTPAPHHSVFYRPDALPATQPTASKHWRTVRALEKLIIHKQQWHNVDRTTEQNRHLGNSHVTKCCDQKLPKHNFGHFRLSDEQSNDIGAIRQKV